MQQVTLLGEQIQEWDNLTRRISDAIELAEMDDSSDETPQELAPADEASPEESEE